MKLIIVTKNEQGEPEYSSSEQQFVPFSYDGARPVECDPASPNLVGFMRRERLDAALAQRPARPAGPSGR